MVRKKLSQVCFSAFLVRLFALPLAAQSYRVQCPAATLAHPRPRCMHLSGGDGFVTMADSAPGDLPTYIFGFSSRATGRRRIACWRTRQRFSPREPWPQTIRPRPLRWMKTTTYSRHDGFACRRTLLPLQREPAPPGQRHQQLRRNDD